MLHVLVAVFGVGQLGALSLLMLADALADLHGAQRLNTLLMLVRGLGFGLLLMLLTGIGLLFVSGWGQALAPWFIASFAAYVALGGVHGWMTITVRRARSLSGQAAAAALRRMRWLVWAGDVLTAAVIVLMVAKPA